MTLKEIQRCANLEDFFQGLLTEALDQEGMKLEQEGTAYLSRLFADFAHHDTLHGKQTKDDPGTPALVDLYARAQSADQGVRFEAFRHLGDVALMVSGLFAPHVERERSLVGVDYYIQMGTSAYGSAAGLARRSGISSLLRELSMKFRRLVEVFTRIAENTTLPVRNDLSALYERLLRNPQSPHIQRRMIAQGAVGVLSVVGA